LVWIHLEYRNWNDLKVRRRIRGPAARGREEPLRGPVTPRPAGGPAVAPAGDHRGDDDGPAPEDARGRSSRPGSAILDKQIREAVVDGTGGRRHRADAVKACLWAAELASEAPERPAIYQMSKSKGMLPVWLE